MPNEVARKFTGTIAGVKTIKTSGGDANWSFASIANNAGRQSVKLDLGAKQPETGWQCRAVVDWTSATAPTAGQTVDFYWAYSSSATAGTDNAGGATGTDAAWTEAVPAQNRMFYIGSLVCSNTAGIQRAVIGVLPPLQRYGCLVAVNKSGQTTSATTTNHELLLTPLIPEIQ